MAENEDFQLDISRMEKLKQLSAAGMIDGSSRYFNHLIDVYGDTGRIGAKRTFTDIERERVDLFLESFVQ